MSAARDKVIGSTIRNTAAMRPTETGKQRTSLVVRVRVEQVELVAPVVPAVRVALVVSEDPVEPAVQVALEVSERCGWRRRRWWRRSSRWRWWCRKTRWRWRCRKARWRRSRELAPVAAELEHGQVAAVLVRGHPRAQLAVALRTKSVTAAHRRGLVPHLAAAEDLAAVVAETTREPAAAEAVIAWEVAVTAVAEAVAAAAAAVAAAGVAVAVADVAAAEEEVGDKRVIDGEKL